MKRTVIEVCVGLVCLLCAPGIQAQHRAAREDQLDKPARKQAADPETPSRAPQGPSETVPQLVVPRLVKFNGVAIDELGRVRTGVVGITFAIYKDKEGGAPLWLETQNVELDEQGRYTILLGATRNEGLPLELFTSGEPRWLGTQVQLPGEVEQARVLLVSVPYALKALDAETLGGLPASAFALAVPSGTASGANVPGTTTQASANPKTTGKNTTTRTAKGAAAATPIAANFIPVFIDNSGNLGSSAMLQSGSNIGIGTTTPGATLDVNGGALALSYQFNGNAAPPTTPVATIFNQANVGPVFSGLSFRVRTGFSTPADALSIDPNQNVSIAGNTNIGGGASALAYTFAGNATPPTTSVATILNQANVGPVFSGLSFRVRTGFSTPKDALTVDPNQNVGIGTTAPGSKLEVDGNTTAFNSTIVGASQAGSNPATTFTFGPTTVPPVAIGGFSTATSGLAAGVGGTAMSPNAAGVGALNFATSGGSALFAASAGAGSTAVEAHAVGTSGSTLGIHATTSDSTGAAALLDNDASGNIVVGRVGPSGGHVNVFRVDGTGKGFFNGGTQTGGADFAEAVAVRGERLQYEPGDVLVVDRTAGRRLMLSRRAYSTRVAGVYSTKPGVLATTHSIDESEAIAAEVPLAIVGIVPCKVTTENGPILSGDLLVTSSTPGYAMKGTNRARMLGAVIGKGLEPLREGQGVIQVLVTLQ